MTRKILGLTGSIATGDATHWGTNDTDYINQLLTGTDQSSTDPVTMATTWLFNNQKLQLRNPANTFTSTVINPAITANSNYQFNVPYDYYIFIDPDDSNKIKARNGRTGVIDSVHATNADVVINAAITNLSSGSTIGTSGDTLNLWSGGQYGAIFVGPGLYLVYSSIVLNPNISLIGAGRWATIFKLADSRTDSASATVMKSSTWDTHSYQAGNLTAAQRQQGDTGIRLMGFSVYGNKKNNTAVVTTDPNVVNNPATTMAQSWGHGIALYGSDNFIFDIFIYRCAGAGIIIQDAPTNLGSTGSTGTGQQDGESDIRRCSTWWNGKQGYLIRAGTRMDTCWSFYNGEAGLEVQDCAYFTGSGSQIFNGWHFLDGQNYSSYNVKGYDVMLRAPVFLYNTWIEGSNAGDSLVLGAAGATPTSSTNYTLTGTTGGGVDIGNLMMDFPKASSILINCGSNRIQARVNGPTGGPLINGITTANSTGVTIADSAFGNFLDLDLRGFDQTTQNALTIGSSTGSSGNQIMLRGHGNYNNINWGTTSNLTNSIYAILMVGPAGGINQNVLVGAAPNYSSNNIRIQSTGYSATPFLGQNGGSVTLSGVASQAAYTIPHLLYAAPNVVNVRPKNAAAVTAGTYYLTADATNITVNFTVAPGNGTSNIFWWDARVNAI